MNGPLPSVLAPITIPLSWAYQRGVAARNRRFDRGEGVERLDLPVISVGNVTLGGSGKTPMVRWIVTELLAIGVTPVIAMRGYGAKPGEVGDEEAEYRDLLPEVPIVAHPKRTDALREFLGDRRDVGCVVLDDGFQHRQLARDLDLVLVDATRHGLDDRVLPAGYLREPMSALDRADALVVTRATGDDDHLIERLARLHGRPPIGRTTHEWTALTIVSPSGDITEAEVDWLSGRRVGTMLGIGNPASVIRQIKDAGATVAATISASDHERYDAVRMTQARTVSQGLDGLVMTRKDWVKVREVIDWQGWASSGPPLVIPELSIDFLAGDQDLRALIALTVKHAASTAS